MPGVVHYGHMPLLFSILSLSPKITRGWRKPDLLGCGNRRSREPQKFSSNRPEKSTPVSVSNFIGKAVLNAAVSGRKNRA